MSTDEANDFVPEHLAKWRKITREYLLAPMEWRELGERILLLGVYSTGSQNAKDAKQSGASAPAAENRDRLLPENARFVRIFGIHRCDCPIGFRRRINAGRM